MIDTEIYKIETNILSMFCILFSVMFWYVTIPPSTLQDPPQMIIFADHFLVICWSFFDQILETFLGLIFRQILRLFLT